MFQPLLKVAEVAEFLNVKKPTVYSLIKAGELPVSVIGNGQFRCTSADVERYAESRKDPKLAQAVSAKNREAGVLGQQKRREAEAA